MSNTLAGGPGNPYRHTKIIATLGPATQSEECLARLIRDGVDVFRRNMAHGSGEWAAEMVARIRTTSHRVGRHVAVMMSGETTTGAYPLESVQVMKNIIGSIEPTIDLSLNAQIKLREPKAKMLRSAAVLAQELGQSGIIVFTRSGFLAYVLAALRPRNVPIYAFTDIDEIFRQLLLPWGVEPFLMEFSDDPEQTILDAIDCLRQRKWVAPGTWLVVITNVLANGQVVDALQLRQVESTQE